MEVLRWTVRMAKDRKLFTPAQFEFGETQSHTPTFVIDWPLNEWVSYDSLLRCRPVAKVGVWYCRLKAAPRHGREQKDNVNDYSVYYSI